MTTTSPAPSAPPDPDLEPGQQVGEYIVQEKIGQGGFGAVFKASHPVIGKVVALKVLARRFSVDPEMVERFVAEARAVNQIRHRNIIDIFSFGNLADGRCYYAMEFLDGDPLDALIERDGAMPIVDALPILRAIARALDACHAKGIAHRDLKPANIFIARDPDGAMYPKLLDFGIAKLMGPEDALKQKTRTGVPMGTPYYMSPEQCRGRDVDHRTDYYAFGIMAFELLTGKVPIDGDDYMTILMKQISDDPPLASSVQPGLPEGIDDGIMWLCRKDPAERPPNLLTAVQALEASAEASGIALPRARESSVQDSVSGRHTPPPYSRKTPVPAMMTALGDDVPAKKSRMPLIVGAFVAIAAAAVVVVLATRGATSTTPAAGSGQPNAMLGSAPTTSGGSGSNGGVGNGGGSNGNVVGGGTGGSGSAGAVAPASAVTVTITGVPEGTEVLVRGHLVGTAPGPVQLDRAADAVVLMLRADGYIAQSKPITPDKDQSLDVTLKKKPGNATSRPTGPKQDKDSLAVPKFD